MDVRKSLSAHVWNAQGLKIPCKSSFRDLGAHLNFTTSPNGATLTARMHKCIGMAKRLRWLPIAHEMKAKLVSTNILPAALYGVEVTSINQAVFEHLRSAIAKALGPRSAKRNVNLTYEFLPGSTDLDPLYYSLQSRVLGMRRIIAKHPRLKGQLKRMIDKRGEPRFKVSKTEPSFTDLIWSNATGTEETPVEVLDDMHAGPVGMLIQMLGDIGYDISRDFTIYMEGECPIDLINMPWQHLKSALRDIVRRKRPKANAPSIVKARSLMLTSSKALLTNCLRIRVKYIRMLALEACGLKISCRTSSLGTAKLMLAAPSTHYGTVLLSISIGSRCSSHRLLQTSCLIPLRMVSSLPCLLFLTCPSGPEVKVKRAKQRPTPLLMLTISIKVGVSIKQVCSKHTVG
jgi:hypothetical protein